MTTALTTVEKGELAEFEQVIQSGLQTFAEVGNALLAIRDGRLYRSEHGTFDAYCKDRWGMSKTHANRLVESAKVIGNLTPIGVTPTTESQARPLSRLAPERQTEAWKGATEKAESEGRRVTARDVEEQVKERTTEKTRTTRMQHVPPCDGMQFANMAIRNMEQIKDNDTERGNAFATVKGWINENE